jgi:hypothetical protein
VFSGQQFIQKGLANGLRDVGSTFYSTCTAENVAIDIDSLAPPVPLHYGRMALGNN